MMARFRRKNFGNKGPLPWVGNSRFLTSHLDPPSPEEINWPTTPLSAIVVDSASVASHEFSGWHHAFAPPSPKLEVTGFVAPKHVPSDDIAKYRLTQLTIHDYAPSSAAKSPHSARLPRYIPIIIPEFAQPTFNRDSDYTASDKAISIPSINNSFSTSTTPTSKSTTSLSSLSHEADAFETRTKRKPCTTVKNISNHNPDDMNTSQVSLVNSEASNDGSGSNPPVNGAASSIGIPSSTSQPNAAPTNLSGLVCNVHRTTGEEPHALVGATTTILGDRLYVFGGRMHSRTKPQLTSDLYELDLIRRHWAKIDSQGDVPPPRYFHSVCALGDSKLVCYGGMSPAVHARTPNGQGTKPAEGQPEVVVMSDIHVFDVPTRKWTQIATSENPQGRYAHCAAIIPSSAAFTSANAPLSAIQHNPPSSDPHSGTLGVQLDGTGGAEMIVVGGQDSGNNYIEQISVFNLRSLKWTNTTAWDRKCGAYKSMVSPMTGLTAELIGRGVPLDDAQAQRLATRPGTTSMLIYSNYNFLDVKLELQIRLPDGSLIEKPMNGPVSPPGLRFPNGGIIDSHFVVSGTYLTSSKHEYALWALDLKTLTWARIDTHGSIFSQGSWNRGILWNRRNTFVILGHRKRSLVDDYNHRRINFSHVCMVELEAFGLYDNPRKDVPTSGYVSVSAPHGPASAQASQQSQSVGGRPLTSMAEQLGQAALSFMEISDMEIVALGGEKIPCNSYLLARRWGPFFNQLLAESASHHGETNSVSDGTTLRPSMRSQQSRNSSLTITPAVANSVSSNDGILDPQRSLSRSTTRTLVDLPNTQNVPASSRPRTLYLPHMAPTIQLLLHFLYTSSIPPANSPMCTPHTLCSLLQMARPYQVDGLLEATVERLHEVLDGRNSAAVFNAAAMAAGGGRGLQGATGGPSAYDFGRRQSEATTIGDGNASLSSRTAGLRLATNYEEPNGQRRGHAKSSSMDSASTATSASNSTDNEHTDTENANGNADTKDVREMREMWTGDLSSVIGLQKRGLRGLMEGRRLRANTGGD
jgi:hypothetical protein